MNCGVTLQHAAVACASGPAHCSSSLLTMHSQLGMQQELELNNSMQTEGTRALQAAVRDALCSVAEVLLPAISLGAMDKMPRSIGDAATVKGNVRIWELQQADGQTQELWKRLLQMPCSRRVVHSTRRQRQLVLLRCDFELCHIATCICTCSSASS